MGMGRQCTRFGSHQSDRDTHAAFSRVPQVKSGGNQSEGPLHRRLGTRTEASMQRGRCSGDRVISRSEKRVDRTSIQRTWIKPRRGAADFDQMPQDPPDFIGFGDDGKNSHRGTTAAADQRIDLIYLGYQPGPGAAAFLIGDRARDFFRVALHGLRSLQVLVLPSRRDQPGHIGHIRPFAFGSGSIEPISPDILRSSWWDVLGEGFAGFVGMRSDPYRAIQGKTRVLPVDEAGGQIDIDELLHSAH